MFWLCWLSCRGDTGWKGASIEMDNPLGSSAWILPSWLKRHETCRQGLQDSRSVATLAETAGVFEFIKPHTRENEEIRWMMKRFAVAVGSIRCSCGAIASE
jgi:hypothetical protein